MMQPLSNHVRSCNVNYWCDRNFSLPRVHQGWGWRSRNIFHQIPAKDGVTPPETGFWFLQLERDRLNVWVVGEIEEVG